MFAALPSTLGLPSSSAQSAYYQTSSLFDRQEIIETTSILAQSGIHPENTRLIKTISEEHTKIEVIQASVEYEDTAKLIRCNGGRELRFSRGDHCIQLRKICEYLQKASQYADSPAKKLYISQMCRSFRTGNMEDFKDSQRTWVRDHPTRVESVLGFIEPYRDPCGTKAEFEGIVGIQNPAESAMLHRLSENANTFVRRLPWVSKGYDGSTMGEFELSTIRIPSFVSIECTVNPVVRRSKYS